MTIAGIERFFTTSITNSNRVERFADECLLAPLHYLLHEKNGSIYPRKYEIMGSFRLKVKVEALPLNPLFIRVLKIFAACIAAFLLTIPGALLKRLAQCEKTSTDCHKTFIDCQNGVNTSARRAFFQDAEGPLIKCLIPLLTVRDLGALCQVEKGRMVGTDREKERAKQMKRDELGPIKMVYQRFWDKHEVALWRIVANRFEGYAGLKEVPAYDDPLHFVKSQINWLAQARQKWVTKGYERGPQLIALFGGIEAIRRLPSFFKGYPTLNNKKEPSLYVDKTSFSDILTIYLRVVRDLKNTVTVPPVHPDGTLFLLGPRQEWTPREEEIDIVFAIREDSQKLSMSIRGALWPANGDELGRGDDSFAGPSQRLENWVSEGGKKWLQDLLAGKTCGRFPGLSYYVPGYYPFPEVTYRLRPIDYQPPQKAVVEVVAP